MPYHVEKCTLSKKKLYQEAKKCLIIKLKKKLIKKPYQESKNWCLNKELN